MTTQFRSRIKSAASYSSEIGVTGACCLPDGSKVFGDNITLYTCNKQDGFFRPGDPDLLQCPDRGLTGCCCACSNVRDQEGTFDGLLVGNDNVFEDNSSYYGTPPSGDNVNEKGLKDNVTQCECYRRKGKWFYGKCNEIGTIESLCGHWENLFTDPPVPEMHDKRFPAACCHGTSGGTTTSLDCSNVCTLDECENLIPTETDDAPYSQYFGVEENGSGRLCNFVDWSLEPVNCSVSGVQRLFANNPSNPQIEEKISKILQEKPNSNQDPSSFLNEQYRRVNDLILRTKKLPCLELKTKDNELIHECSQKTFRQCTAAKGFIYPNMGNDILNCSDLTTYLPKRGTGGLRIIPASTSSSNMPEVGAPFQGGLYAGIFEPGISVVKRQKGKKIVLEPSRKIGPGASNKKWGLIVSFTPFNPYDRVISRQRMNTESEPSNDLPTSYYDGFFNTYGDGAEYFGYPTELFQKIRSLVFRGFTGWYVPSIDELSFIYSKLHNGVVDGITGLLNPKYIGKFGREFETSLATGFVQGTPLLSKFLVGDFMLSKMMSSTLVEVDDMTTDGSVKSSQIVNGNYRVFSQSMTHNYIRRVRKEPTIKISEPILAYSTEVGDAVGDAGKIYQDLRTKPILVPLVQRIYIDD